MISTGIWDVSSYDGGWDCVRNESGSIICQLVVNEPDNGPLIAEAGTVYNETGFTPRQLADQKDALLEACKKMQLEWMERGQHKYGGVGAPAAIFAINTAIADATTKPIRAEDTK